MKRNLAMTLLASAALGATGLVAAQDRQTNDNPQTPQGESVQIQSVTVPYDTAEIQDERGAEKLFFRIRRAAAEACDVASHEVGYERWEEHACEASAVSNAVQDVAEPALIEYYSDLRGSVLPEER